MPYVRCPTCTQVGYATAGYSHPVLCAHCGAVLPSRRQVVPVTALPRRRGGPGGPAAPLRLARDAALPGPDPGGG